MLSIVEARIINYFTPAKLSIIQENVFVAHPSTCDISEGDAGPRSVSPVSRKG